MLGHQYPLPSNLDHKCIYFNIQMLYSILCWLCILPITAKPNSVFLRGPVDTITVADDRV